MSYKESNSSDNFDDALLDNVSNIAPTARPPNAQKELDDLVLLSDSHSDGSCNSDSEPAKSSRPAAATATARPLPAGIMQMQPV
eukprot:5595288-Pleurochrysis_carterae.AAC.2